jgi:peptidoglycan/LPS O-acetylase OafA/YrhL
MTLSEAYAKNRPNFLNGLRLLLAAGVIAWHSFALTGRDFSGLPAAQQLLSQVFVDGFFAISGFLIARSWMRNPNVRSFLQARALRILPAFWVCLIVTGLLFSPLSNLLSGAREPWAVLATAGPYIYMVGNAALWVFQRGIEGTLTHVPYQESWNGSLWTLAWEVMCYVAVMTLGLLHLIGRKAVLWILFVVILSASVGEQILDLEIATLENALRFGLMFLAGTLVAAHSDDVRVSKRLMSVAFILVGAAAFTPDYRLIGALPLAYGLIALGGLVSYGKLEFRNDVSYGLYIYAFPVQQLLASAGLYGLDVAVFWLLSTMLTVVLAAASWFLVEKPILRQKGRVRSRRGRLRTAPGVITR